MLVAYREFVRAAAPPAASVLDADTRLAAFIADRVERVAVTTGAPRRPRGRWFELPAFRIAAVAAASAAIAVAVTQWRDGPETTVLRGDPRVVVTLEAPRALPDGAVELAWSSVPDADGYQVVLLRDDLSEIVRFPASADERLTLDRAAIPAGATHWQVAALREGAVVAESTPESLSP
jgi:hypothetical protein